MKNRLILMALLILIPIAANSSVAVGAATSAAIAASRSRHQNEIINAANVKERLLSNGGITSVFVCPAADPKSREYYGSFYDSCRLWSADNGYYRMLISDIPEKLFPQKELVNILFINTGSDSALFEFYFRG